MPLPQLRFDIPVYDQATFNLMDKGSLVLVALDSMLSQVPIRRTVHNGPNRNVREPQPLDQPLGVHEFIIEIPFDIIRSTDVEGFLRILYDFAEAQKRELGASLFHTLNAVTEAIGNNINAQGAPLSFDMINDMVERLELGVDEQGQLLPPRIHAGREMVQRLKELKPTEEQLQRFNEIMQRKQEEYNAQKRTRRLPR